MKIAIIGQGNVAWHLHRMLNSCNEIVAVNSRTLQQLPRDADLYLIAVSDDAIAELASKLPVLTGLVAHTSGSVSISALQPYASNIGVFYPLQTFSKESELEYSKIPVFIEAETDNNLKLLKNAANSFSKTVIQADSNRRRRLHIASVFACNYVNYLWKVADDILQADGLSLNMLQPLIDASINKIKYMTPSEAQTGPASRGDKRVVTEHIEWLHKNLPELEKLYATMASNIMN